MKRLAIFTMLALAAVSGVRADETPSYPGGKPALDKYIKDNLKYPEMAKENGVEGVVDVQFLVKTDGSLGTIKVVRLVDPDLEEEAIRLVKNMPNWIPAEKDGVPFEAPAEVDVPFILE